MFSLLVSLAIVASVASLSPQPLPQYISYSDLAAPGQLPELNGNHVSVDITLDLAKLVNPQDDSDSDSDSDTDSDSDSDSKSNSNSKSECATLKDIVCSNLFLIDGVTVLLAVVVSAWVCALYVRRHRMQEQEVVLVKDTV